MGFASANVAVYHHATGVARCELNVHNDRVVRECGVDLAEKVATQYLVLAGFAERLPSEGRGFAVLDYDAGDTGLNARREDKDGCGRKTDDLQHTGHYMRANRRTRAQLDRFFVNGGSDALTGIRTRRLALSLAQSLALAWRNARA